MFQSLPFSIGLRYLRAKRRNGFITERTLRKTCRTRSETKADVFD